MPFTSETMQLNHFTLFFDVEIIDWRATRHESSDITHSTENWINCRRLMVQRSFVLQTVHTRYITQSVYRIGYSPDDRGIVVRFPAGTREAI